MRRHVRYKSRKHKVQFCHRQRDNIQSNSEMVHSPGWQRRSKSTKVSTDPTQTQESLPLVIHYVGEVIEYVWSRS